MDLEGTTKIPLSLVRSIKNSLKVIEKRSFRREDIERKLFKKTDFYPIIESYYDIIKDSLLLENIKTIESKLILNFFETPQIENIIGKLYAPNHLDPLGYYDINKIYSDFEDLVLENFQLENYTTINFTTVLFEILIEGCNETLTELNNEGDISSQNALYNYNEFIKQYKKMKELYKVLRNYPSDVNYLPRKVIKAENYLPDNYLFPDYQNSENIFQAIDKNKRIVLLSDAGNGKTTELRQIAYHYSRNRIYHPIIIYLNKYTNKSITEYFPKYWELIPEENLIILLDGLDEIESKNIYNAVREIEFFVDKYPNTCVVVSCRTNFYKTESKNGSDTGTLNGFTSYKLLNLENNLIEKYVKDKLGLKSSSFFDSIHEKKLYLFLKSPFYLINLIKLFIKNNNLPKSKAEIFENLLELRINFDIKHYYTTKELEKQKNNVMKNLQYVALAMECLGRNYIYDEELEEILPKPSSRELLEYCTTWIKQQSDKITWQFEHNSFQEYLAAKKLATTPLETIKEIVSFDHKNNRIVPSWTNTLSFLISIYNTDDLEKWVLSVQPELFINFEHNKINIEERIRIFKEIFESYEMKETWINIDKFRIAELAKFGESAEIVDYLLNKTENGMHYTTIGTSIELLCELNIPIEKRDKTKELLIKRALETSYNGIIQERALKCLSIHKFDSKEIIDQIVLSLRKSRNDHIRSGIYRLLCNSNYLNDYTDIFLEGFDCAFSRKIFSSSELKYLKEGFNKANSQESTKKIIEFFKNKPENLEKLYLDKEIGFLTNVIQVYKKDPSILDSCLELFKVLLIGHERQALRFLRSFDNTNSRLHVFQKIYSERNVENYSFLILGTLANKNCIDFFIKEYEEGRITDVEIWKLQNSLKFAFENKELYLQFNEVVVKKFGDKFALLPEKDYEKMRIQGIQRDIELIFNKELFLEEITRIFKISKKEKLTRSELTYVKLEHFGDNFSDLIIHLLYKIAGDNTVSLKEAIKHIDGLNWDYFFIKRIYEISIRNRSIIFTQKQRESISHWCLLHAGDVDFKNAIYKTDNRKEADLIALILWHFLRKFDLNYPTNVLLDMISFDWSYSGSDFAGIEYLEKRLSYPDIEKRVLENLNNGIEYDFILENHITFCRNHRIKQIIQFTPDIIIDANRDYSTRKLALDTNLEISEDLDKLEVLLTGVKDNFKWIFLETLIGKNRNCETILLSIYKKGDKDDKLKASAYLIRLQNIKGLEYLIEWIKENGEYPWFINGSPLRFLQSFIFVPGLLKLLKIGYQDNISQDHIHSLPNDVLEALSGIAMISEQNFYRIKKCIENFITHNLSNIENINFLYSYLENLELIFSVVGNKDINYVITKFQELNITIK